jgi:hypothetical protein
MHIPIQGICLIHNEVLKNRLISDLDCIGSASHHMQFESHCECRKKRGGLRDDGLSKEDRREPTFQTDIVGLIGEVTRSKIT